MRSVTRKRLLWILFVIIFVWVLSFVIITYFLPEVVETESVEIFKGIALSGIASGTLALLLLLITAAIVIDNIVTRRREN